MGRPNPFFVGITKKCDLLCGLIHVLVVLGDVVTHRLEFGLAVAFIETRAVPASLASRVACAGQHGPQWLHKL